jgi:vancomycin resistance protein YoaR
MEGPRPGVPPPRDRQGFLLPVIEPAQLPAPRRRALRYTASALGGLALLWLVAFLAAGDGVPRGTTVRGVSIGGMSPQRAEATLARELADEAKALVAVRVGSETLEIDPVSAGLRLDAAGTVSEAGHRSWNPIALVAGLLGAGDMDPSVSIEKRKLSAAVGSMAQQIDGKPVEGGVRFDGDQVVPVEPHQGRTVDRSDAVDKIGAAYLREDPPVVLTAEIVEPQVDSAEVQRAVQEFAEPAMSGSVDLTVDGKAVTLPPSLIGPALTMVPNNEHRLEPVLDGGKLKASLADELTPFERKPQDATFRIVGGRPRVVPARVGRIVDPEQLSAVVLPVLTLAGDARTAALSPQEADPKLTTAEAKALRITELVSEFTTFYPSNFPPRLTNIHRAADLMDNTLLLPGKTFSLNKEVGERTGARGFAQGYVISGGKLEVDFGGGVSQLATTTFNAAFFAGLEDVEHHPHSFYISRYPEGREATVAWGVKDLRFRNDTDTGIFITTSYTSGSVTVRTWGTKIYTVGSSRSARYNVKPFQTVYNKKPAGNTPGDCVPQPGVPGFTVDVKRRLSRGGTLVRTENLHTVYKQEQRIICGSSGPTPTPTPPPDD